MKLLEAKKLSVRYGEHQIVDDVSFSLEEGQWLMIAGPNGAGKSTIVSALGRGAPYTGQLLWQGKDLARLSHRELARNMGILSQNHSLSYSFTVEEVVRLGRYAHSRGLFGETQGSDSAAVEKALALCGLSDLAGQSVLTLSGGELQRCFLAQLFAQEPRVLILDEPTNHLDLVYQKQCFALIRTWLKEPGRAVISVVHDLSLARAYGSHALLLHRGRCLAQGEARAVLSPENLEKAYDMDVFAWMRQMLAQWQEET